MKRELMVAPWLLSSLVLARVGAAQVEPGAEAAATTTTPTTTTTTTTTPTTATATAMPRESLRLLLQRVEAVGVPVQLARSLEEALVLELGSRKGFAVVSPAELEETVKYAKDRTALGCDMLDECMVEVRKRLKADRMIRGTVSKLGSELVATFAVIELRNGEVSRRVTRSARDFAGLRTELPPAVDEMLGAAARAPAFTLPPGETLKLAVMPLAARGVPQATTSAMTQILAAELNQIEGVRVISSDDIAALLAKVETEGKLGCTDNMECVVEIGAALGLSKLVTGAVGRIGDTYVVSAQLIDTRNAEVQNRVLEAFAGDADELARATKLTAYRIAGVDYRPRPGSIDFSFNVEHAQVRLGARELSLHDRRVALDRLEPGRYSLRVLPDAKRFVALQTDVYVAPGAGNVRSFDLKEIPRPIYETWWFWTAVGIVVAGGTALAIALAADAPSSGGSGTVTVHSVTAH